jgi:maltooligosyltrehalose trehalohydrolase
MLSGATTFTTALHTLLTGEDVGLLRGLRQPRSTGQGPAKRVCLSTGFTLATANARHGSDASHRPPYQLVVCAQNHDQVGNRMLGERFTAL